MDEFKDKFFTIIPPIVYCCIQMENELDSIDDKIRTYKQRIEMRQEQLKCDKVKEFIANEASNCKLKSEAKLIDSISSLNKLNCEFNKFDNEILSDKKTGFDRIEHTINDWMELKDRNIVCLGSLLEQTKDAFRVYVLESKANLNQKTDIDQKIPVVSAELEEKQKLLSKLTEQYRELTNLDDEKEKMLAEIKSPMSDKQLLYKEYVQKNEKLNRRLQNKNRQIGQQKSNVRKLILEFLNKIKQFESLDKEKDQKLSLKRKYSMDSVAELLKKKENLKTKIAEFESAEKQISECSSGSKIDLICKSEKSQLNALKSFKQVNDRTIRSKLNSLNNSYQKLISKFENQLNTNPNQDDQPKSKNKRKKRSV